MKSTSCFVSDRNFNNKVDLSIIIPVYNGESFISKCISSVLSNNTRYHYEVIIVNDGSTDGSANIIDKFYRDNMDTIRVITTANNGLSSARNTGLDHACGKYISFIDCDDFINKSFIDDMLDCAYKNNADIVKCGTMNYYLRKNSFSISELKKYSHIVGPMKEKILDYSSFAWGTLYKNYLFKNVSFPVGFYYEDMIIRFLLFRSCRCFIYLDKLYYYRTIHRKQLTNYLGQAINFNNLDSLYLIELLVHDNNLFEYLDNDLYLYLDVLHECSFVLTNRIDNFDIDIKRQVFHRVNALVTKIYNPGYEKYLKGKFKVISDVILKNRFDLWILFKRVYY